MGYRLNCSINLSELATALSLSWEGVEVKIKSISPYNSVSESDLTFTSRLDVVSSGYAVITTPDQIDCDTKNIGILVSESPRLAFIKALDFLVREIGFSSWSHPAIIDPTASIGRNVVIENGCVVGANSIIEHNVVLHSGTRVGQNSRIRSCSSIGGDGFGFERMPDGIPLRFPHLGGVIIGNNVEIGSCTAIARGTLSDTIIEDEVKIDNLVHIAHNCLIKNGAFIIACAEISGGVEIGKNAWVAPNSCTHQKISVGDGAIIGLGAVVTKNVPSFTVYAGNPAKKLRDIE
ncbi:MAG: UDP-3-O-(3-hydroxymyristoyl)glucosamine N-acyltransferase [Gammaproteobacteria bacterium HGW-Gammaproteobacteria-11]|nr:MAG: UDP-3-O-(3-hydroxymyristoyl)glucosamine N-acyltransferase [Gammaproteobacteria bacterium HGW-Gammaproteobacteria-11]